MAPKLLLPMCSSRVPLVCPCAFACGARIVWLRAARVTGEDRAPARIYAMSAGRSMDAAIMSHPGGATPVADWGRRASIAEVGRSAALVRARVPVTAAAASTEIIERRRLTRRPGGQFHRDRLRAPDRATLRQCRRRGHHGQSCYTDRQAQHGCTAKHVMFASEATS